MQILLYPYYFLRSIFLRGFFNSIHLAKSELQNEKLFAIETMAIKKSKSKEFFHYQGAGYIILFRIFELLKPYTGRFEFVDIGCGKGRVLFVAERYGFEWLTGIELDPTLLAVAEKNLVLYKKRPSSVFKFINANALDYQYRNVPTVYFLFNPFNEEVMEKVLDRIIRHSTSETIFIYMNPMYRSPFEKRKLEVLATIKTRWYLEAVIYRSAGNLK